ncbi:MAG: PAS domain-containing protein, partial [Arenicellales bacterium]
MTRSFERLTETQLAEELASFEERMAGRTRGSRLKKLVENLRIHQIELEMQNRELRDTQTALEEARDRFADLYDFAPVGYLTLNTRGEIQEINLTGTRMLGSPRAELLKKPLSSYLEGGQSKIFFRHLSRAFADDTKATVELALRSGDRETPWVLMESLRTGRDT